MGGEIVKLKNENRRTQTKFQRIKSYHNQRKRGGGTRFGDFDTENDINISRHNSDRRHFMVGDRSYESPLSDASDVSGAADSEEEFRRRRKSLRRN